MQPCTGYASGSNPLLPEVDSSHSRHSILYFSYLVGLGGGEVSLVTLTESLNRQRFMPHVICPAWGPLPDRLCTRQVPVHVIPYRRPRRRLGVVPSISVTAVARLYRFTRRQETALIHVNDFESLVYAGPAARLLGIPVVWTCWGWWNAGGRVRGLFIHLFADRVIAVSQAVQDRLLAASPKLSGTFAMPILPGIDLDTFRPHRDLTELRADLDLPMSGFVVSIVGRFQPIKGHSDFLAAARLIRRHYPETHFLIVGDNTFDIPDEEMRVRQLREQVFQDSWLRSHVHFTGFREDIPAILSLSDVVVCASDFESFGFVNVEAMACETPVVSTNVGGPAETVVDGKTGFLVSPHQPQEIADRVCQLLQDPLLRHRMGQQGREWVSQRFSLDIYVQRIETIYEDLLQG